MSNVAVIGAQWGDEGKGKIVDWLCARADVVVRFQGGHNAGHTLVIDGVTYTPESLLVAENAVLILPLHRELDETRESSNSIQKLGTTKRGIGPAYEDKVGRRALRVIDLKEFKSLPAKIERLLAHHNALRRGNNLDELDAHSILESLKEVAPKILPFAGCAWRRLDQARREGKRILFEGAQAVLLDIDHGTYPYVTSSNTVAGQAAAGAGISPRDIGYVLGIVKAYTT